jgi:xanthine/CO dehydrogenase XdhC/CoxF family maturation factor
MRRRDDGNPPYDGDMFVGEEETGSAVMGLDEPQSRRLRHDDRPRRGVLLAFAAAAAALVVIPLILSRVVDQPTPEVYTIEIPAGTAARLAAGGVVDLFPEDLDFKLRDVLVVVNHDDVAHTIGPVVVMPGGRVERNFGEVASISGFCSLHPSGGVTIEIGE